MRIRSRLSFKTQLLTINALLFGYISHASAQSSIISGEAYTLTAKTSGLSLDNRGQTDTGPMGQWSAISGNTNQQWRLMALGNGRYMLINLTSGMALDDGGSSTNGSAVTQFDADTTNLNQQWTLVDVGNGYTQLVNAASHKALDNGGTHAVGDPVTQWDPLSGNTNQQWLLAPVQIGARTPFTTLEAEAGSLSGGASVVALTSPPTTKFSSPELEASGHAYVHLSTTGQQVGWTNTTGAPVTAINVRYSLPDAPNGGGISSTIDLYVDNVFRQTISVNSRQTWIYENDSNYDGSNQVPSSGVPHVFWDETHAFIKGAPVAPGSTISLRKDAGNDASFYDIDLVDIEAPPAPATQPAHSLSIADCGAVPDNIHIDSTSAIQRCFDQARTSGQSVWIPQGTFYLNTTQGLNAQNIVIEGAGMWYSTIYYNPPLPSGTTNNVFLPTSVVMRNFAIDGNAVSGGPGDGNGGAINIKGSHWVIDSLWIQHEGAGIWADGDDGIVENCRINNTWADGINLNNGSGAPGNDSGNDLTAQNNFIRGSGDDGLAINDGGGATHGMQNTTLINNTVVSPWWANNIGVYGGTNDVVANNLVTDSVKEYGISVGVFGTNGALVSAWIEGNTVLRGGSNGYGNAYPAVGLGVTGTVNTVSDITFRGNSISDTMFDGLGVYTQGQAWVQYTVLDSPGRNGYVIEPGAQGAATLFFNQLTNLKPGQLSFLNGGSGTFDLDSRGNSGLSIP